MQCIRCSGAEQAVWRGLSGRGRVPRGELPENKQREDGMFRWENHSLGEGPTQEQFCEAALKGVCSRCADLRGS